jgi:cell division septum initiation protein DivIVA
MAMRRNDERVEDRADGVRAALDAERARAERAEAALSELRARARRPPVADPTTPTPLLRTVGWTLAEKLTSEAHAAAGLLAEQARAEAAGTIGEAERRAAHLLAVARHRVLARTAEAARLLTAARAAAARIARDTAEANETTLSAVHWRAERLWEDADIELAALGAELERLEQLRAALDAQVGAAAGHIRAAHRALAAPLVPPPVWGGEAALDHLPAPLVPAAPDWDAEAGPDPA